MDTLLIAFKAAPTALNPSADDTASSIDVLNSCLSYRIKVISNRVAIIITQVDQELSQNVWCS
jgi:hypothetical protein